MKKRIFFTFLLFLCVVSLKPAHAQIEPDSIPCPNGYLEGMLSPVLKVISTDPYCAVKIHYCVMVSGAEDGIYIKAIEFDGDCTGDRFACDDQGNISLDWGAIVRWILNDPFAFPVEDPPNCNDPENPPLKIVRLYHGGCYQIDHYMDPNTLRDVRIVTPCFPELVVYCKRDWEVCYEIIDGKFTPRAYPVGNTTPNFDCSTSGCYPLCD